MADTKISPPWITFARKVYALFGKDEDVNVIYDNDNTTLALYVTGADKADAIQRILPSETYFGNVALHIKVIPSNDGEVSTETLFRRAFEGNPVFVGAQAAAAGTPMAGTCYVQFAPMVAQFFNDDLSDLNGFESTLYENIAADVLSVGGCVYGTEIGDNADPIWP